ncbi:MAG TPA: DUF6515 family protein [Steroidobacteraceae bacterium]|jgi:hypothetical protein
MTRNTSIGRATLLTTLGIAAAMSFSLAGADPRDDHRDDQRHAAPPHEHVDARFNHNHAYFDRGYVVHDLPRDRIVINHGPNRFYYSAGVWYAPRGAGFVVVSPPIGVFVPVLPPFYSTVWFGGVPYYYANDTYYMWDAPDHGYEVVDTPTGAVNAAPDAAPPPPPASTQLFVYPRNGQTADQQAKDKYECHTWGVGQTGFDPTASGGNVPADQFATKSDAYNRALSACLQGRGYSVQ